MKIPKSLIDAINEEPDRFLKYFNLNMIKSSKNPMLEFLRQFERKFGNRGGLYLWQYVVNNYDLTNRFYKTEKIQKSLPNEFKGDILRDIVDEFFDKYQIKEKEKQKKINDYVKEAKIRKAHKYSEIQKRFISSNSEMGNLALAYRFNSLFGTRISVWGIRDKKYRLLGKKK
jgi:hypothetical protein